MNSATDHPDISVIVATYGREAVLCETLDCLLDQDHPNYEVIVADQTPAHEARTEQFLRARRDRLRYLRIARPSLPNARNIGIRHARGDIVLFVDDDVIPARSLVSAHAGAYAGAHVGAVAGQVLPREGNTVDEPVVGQLDRCARVTWNFHSTLPTETMYATGGNMSFRRALLHEAGLFSPAFGGNAYFEEVDLCLRLRRLGQRNRLRADRVAAAPGGRHRWLWEQPARSALVLLVHPQ